MSQFTLQGAFEDGFGELLEQAVMAEEQFRSGSVFEQFVNQFGSDVDWHSTFSFLWNRCVLLCHLHNLNSDLGRAGISWHQPPNRPAAARSRNHPPRTHRP